METQKPFVAFKPKGGNIEVSWMFNTLYKQEKSGKFSCYIPSFDIYFSASDKASIDKKSNALTNLFFDHFFDHTPRNKTFKLLALELHKLGFKAKNDAYTLKQFIDNHSIASKFNSENAFIPSGFEDSNEITKRSQMEVAA